MNRDLQLWCFLRIVGFILIAGCVICLTLCLYLTEVVDNFSHINNKNDTSSNCKTAVKKTVNVSTTQGSKSLTERIKEDNSTADTNSTSQNNLPKTNLSDLLILYPCCTVLLIVMVMQLLSHFLMDPINKCANLIFILICIILATAIFLISMLIALISTYIPMIIISICAILFAILELGDFIFVLFS